MRRTLQKQRHNPVMKQELLKADINHKIQESKQQQWKQLCDKPKHNHISSAILWRKLRSIDNNTTSNQVHKIKLNNIDNPTNNQISNAFGDQLADTFNINIANFAHEKKAVNHRNTQQLPQETSPITSKELSMVIKKLKTKVVLVQTKSHTNISNWPQSI